MKANFTLLRFMSFYRWASRMSVLFPTLAFAQLTSMSTVYDGSTLYFTSELSQTGTGQPRYGKLFFADESGVHPLFIRERVVELDETSPIQRFRSNDYNLLGVDISSGGERLSVVGFRDCFESSSACGVADRSELYDDTGKFTLRTEGSASFSPDGKWALATAIPLSGGLTRYRIFDLSSGADYSFNVGLAGRDWRSHDIANNGTAVIVDETRGRLTVFRPQEGPIQIDGPFRSAVIDAAGTIAVMEMRGSGGSSLQVMRIGSSSLPFSLRMEGRSDYAPKISDDGTLILFLSTTRDSNDPQVFLIHPDGTGRKQITTEPEGISSAVLSGDGHVLWALTQTGRLLKIDLLREATREYIGPVAAFLRPAHQSGTQLEPVIFGSAGQVVTTEASVVPGESVEIEVNGEPATVTEVGRQRVSFQIPSTIPREFRLYEVTIRKNGDSGWVPNITHLQISGVAAALPNR